MRSSFFPSILILLSAAIRQLISKEVMMERINEQQSDLIDLGEATSETRGAQGNGLDQVGQQIAGGGLTD